MALIWNGESAERINMRNWSDRTWIGAMVELLAKDMVISSVG